MSRGPTHRHTSTGLGALPGVQLGYGWGTGGVRPPADFPDWGIGQVQSNIAGRITVNFREQGKVVIDGNRIELVPVFDA